ncbi:MAG: glycosyltransferase [Clostridia bacterium]|nr:glycosyltransferase [Clostridia bacterium]
MPALHCIIYIACTGVLFFFLGRILPRNLINADNPLLRVRPWEQKLFTLLRLPAWQNKVPDMSRIFKKLMPPKKLEGNPSNETLLTMIKEACVAEIIHTLLCLTGLWCLKLWPGLWGVVVTLVYILIGNFPFILIQRYNRPRMMKLAERKRAVSEKRFVSEAHRGVLILSANTGEGHNACAKAIKEVYDRNGEPCDIIDGLSFYSLTVSKIVSWTHTFMYRYMPGFFAWAYGASEKKRTAGNFATFFAKRAAEHLYAFLLDRDYDTLIFVHVFPALLAAAMKEEFDALGIKSCFVATDHTCSPTVELSNADRYFIPDAMYTDEFVKGNITRDRIVASGIPVRSAFYTHTDRATARAKFGIPENARHLLVMGGSMGCKSVIRVVDRLAFHLKPDQYVTIICGNNKKLEKKLGKRFSVLKRVRVLGFVSDVSTLMDSADLYLTKPGGLSTTESAVKGLPMVLIDTVAACERYNMLYYTMQFAAVTAKENHELANLCRRMLDTPAWTQRMRESCLSLPRNNAAAIIRDTMNALKSGEANA